MTKETHEAPERVLLAVSFGTSHSRTREETIGAIEAALGKAYPEYALRRAFTSPTILRILRQRDGLAVDNLSQALERLAAEGASRVVVQPTHFMNGFEYDELSAVARSYESRFPAFSLGRPLLRSEEDCRRLAAVLLKETREHRQPGTALVFVGHGTEHPANAVYRQLQAEFARAGHPDCFVGTVEAEPSPEEVLEQLAAAGAASVVLLPLMIVAGEHAVNDVAGAGADSWKSRLTAAGYPVTCVMRGLGQYPGVRELFISHAALAMAPLSAPGEGVDRTEELP